MQFGSKTDHELVDKQTAQQKEYNFSQCIDYIKKNCKEGDLVITLGCGDVYKLAKRLAKRALSLEDKDLLI